MSEVIALYKLIILYILNRVAFPLSHSQLEEIILEKEYTNYFTLQETIRELLDVSYISAEKTGSRTQYSITDSGKDALSYFENRISQTIRGEIDAYLKEHSFQMKNETSISSEILKVPGEEYYIHGLIKDGASVLLEVKVAVPEEDQAMTGIAAWEKNCQQIYENIMSRLLTPPDTKK